MSTGLCTNENCTGPARHTPVDYYPGPGRFCPDCGGELEPTATPLPIPPVPGLALGAESRLLDALAPSAPPRVPWNIVPIVAAMAVLAIAIGAFAAWRSGAFGHDSGIARVCTTSITARLGDGIARAYLARSGVSPQRVAVVAAGSDACDVRFRASATAAGGTLLGHEGVVIVVNPANPLTRLSAADLRGVLSGRITDWSQLGAPAGTIAAFVPPDDSDETSAIGSTIVHGSIDARVHRMASSEDVVRHVASPSGRAALGITSFGAAVPAKVLALRNAPPPSTISIADGRYPLALAIVVGSDLRSPPGIAADMLSFARTPEAQAIVAKTGVVGTKEP